MTESKISSLNYSALATTDLFTGEPVKAKLFIAAIAAAAVIADIVHRTIPAPIRLMFMPTPVVLMYIDRASDEPVSLTAFDQTQFKIQHAKWTKETAAEGALLTEVVSKLSPAVQAKIGHAEFKLIGMKLIDIVAALHANYATLSDSDIRDVRTTLLKWNNDISVAENLAEYGTSHALLTSASCPMSARDQYSHLKDAIRATHYAATAIAFECANPNITTRTYAALSDDLERDERRRQKPV